MWATINTGFFGTSQSFAPLLRSRVQGDDVVLSVDKEVVKDALRIDDDGHLDDQATNRLYQYYEPHLRRSSGREPRADDRGRDGTWGRGRDRDHDGIADRDERGVDRDRDGIADRDERAVDRDRDGIDDRDERGRGVAGAAAGAAAGGVAAGVTGGRRNHDRDRDGKDDRVQRVLGDHDRDNDGIDDRRERDRGRPDHGTRRRPPPSR